MTLLFNFDKVIKTLWDYTGGRCVDRFSNMNYNVCLTKFNVVAISMKRYAAP